MLLVTTIFIIYLKNKSLFSVKLSAFFSFQITKDEINLTYHILYCSISE
jgi:hypothetical protein